MRLVVVTGVVENPSAFCLLVHLKDRSRILIGWRKEESKHPPSVKEFNFKF
jgi:hypothetical protein